MADICRQSRHWVQNSLPTWTTGMCGSNRSALLPDTCSHDRSHQISQPCPAALQDTGVASLLPGRQSLLSCKTRSDSHSAVWVEHLQIHGGIETSPVVVGEQASMEKTTQRFQKIATTLADLNAEGLNVQTVNDLLTMYVGAASQHVLRMSFVPEQEAQNFDGQVLTFWSRLMHRDITSQLLFSTPQTWRFWSGFCCPTACSCSMARVAVGHSLHWWQQPSHQTQTPSSMQHHDFVPN